METRSVGGLAVSAIGLGCNQFGTFFDEATSAAVVRAAVDQGITLFDTADEYGDGLSEQFLGRALGADRGKVVIATKFGSRFAFDKSGTITERPAGEGGGSARWIRFAVERSLKNLGTDFIDLYQFHFPDDAVPIDETLRALEDLVVAGKVRHIGCCNFSAAQIDAAQAALPGIRFLTAQNQLNLIRQDAARNILPACQRHGMGFLPYFPLASGVLTGKYRRGEKPPPGTRAHPVRQGHGTGRDAGGVWPCAWSLRARGGRGVAAGAARPDLGDRGRPVRCTTGRQHRGGRLAHDAGRGGRGRPDRSRRSADLIGIR
jgi:aryl-alcohol dehydrogenase-like predicted oxidoreductase